MKSRLIIIVAGLLGSVVLAVTWVNLRAELRAAARAQEDLAQSERALLRERTSCERRVVAVQGDLVERKRVMLATQSAADRARANVGPFVAQLKAEHAGRAPVVRPPPPPAVTGGGAFFPELMSDPEYNALYAQRARHLLQVTHGADFRKLGVPEEKVAKAIALLADEQAATMDLQNLGGGALGKDFSELWEQIHRETGEQLQSLLGAETYRRYLEQDESVNVMHRMGADRLEQRLSYSSEPLTSGQVAQMVAYEASLGDPRKVQQAEWERTREARKNGVIPVDEARLAFYRSVLTPAQMAAVEELHGEAEASLKRSLLPREPEKKPADATK